MELLDMMTFGSTNLMLIRGIDYQNLSYLHSQGIKKEILRTSSPLTHTHSENALGSQQGTWASSGCHSLSKRNAIGLRYG